ncbi:ABC-type tungstate transport system, permease component TupB [Thermacetogenium phaeum DSM 12270]|jgi:tungstate transport system substrate-binding protein|uniref:ABC-type tungstate transport system, permease component TupB n=1 Tax=Thermacetogenium phaeum (strain ATCC BAA-254 / DSM 26808 / PB) TaxID=1089553 RepID=K4LF76_THEPS|nr:substrate-binding domain-containing protein [Thermacetogenium phaeum]AFV10645.1 ABC-type tungstate transport system, permease component TupB [Thermacetogenium phaeum DSM 12270]MDK2880245.1 tungstate transport system substrate-binding protein [Clostridia bacterium]
MKPNRRLSTGILFLFLCSILAFAAGCGEQQEQAAAKKDVILATTTSTVDTGLLDELIPIFEEKTGYRVKPIDRGTGEALEMGKKGEADVLLTHAPASERPLVENGDVINYQLVMHNDFIIVGPPDDPAQIKGEKDATEAFKKIMNGRFTFVSRGDDSGTHKKEKAIWDKLGVTPAGDWYLEAGSGMADTLRLASEKNAYTLTDRGTYLAQKDNLKLASLMEGDPMLLNIYHVMQVNPEKFPKVNAAGAKAFVEFMISPETQRIIGDFGVDKYGQPLFIPDAGKSEEEIGMQ